MKGSVRYILTRPCLSEGSVRLLKYLESVFPEGGAVTLLDDKGAEYEATVDRAAGRVLGLGELYARFNLGVNDVLLITPLAERRYQVECVVKPLGERSAAATRRAGAAPQRVVVSESAYVREVRLERRAPTEVDVAEQTPANVPASADSAPDVPAQLPLSQPPLSQPPDRPAPVRMAPIHMAPTQIWPEEMERAAPSHLQPILQPPHLQTEPLPDPDSLDGEAALEELCARTGYRCERPAPGLLRLRADLGAQGYSVLIALSGGAATSPEWRAQDDYRAVLVREGERPASGARLTREALSALLEHARLAKLSPIELRGYWNTGSFDLESVASVAELVSAQLSQRGVFSFVLLTLAQQPAYSVVSRARLAERLGSGVNDAELSAVLQTLSAAPFSVLSALGDGQFYLRASVPDTLRALSEYADGLRLRLGAQAKRPAAVVR